MVTVQPTLRALGSARKPRFRLASRAALAVALVFGGDSVGSSQANAQQSGANIEEDEQLLQALAASPELPRVLYRLGKAYQASGRYREAALQYETLALKFPGTPVDSHLDLPWALKQAALLRRSLGEDDKSIEDVNLYVKNYGGRPELIGQATSLLFGVGSIYEERKDYARLKQHYTNYLRTWAPRGGIDLQIIAEVKLGELAWRSSCPVAGVDDLCMDLQREPARARFPYQPRNLGKKLPPVDLGPCGPRTKARITVHERNPVLVKQALAYFAAALAIYEKGAGLHDASVLDERVGPERIEGVIHHVALAQMAQADRLFEELMRMQVPKGLFFNPVNKPANAVPVQQFQAWMGRKQRNLDQVQAQYQRVFALKSPYGTLAAAARMSQLLLAYANGLYATRPPVPPMPPPPNSNRKLDRDEWGWLVRDAFCDQMEDAAFPIEDQAKVRLLACVHKASELSTFNDWSRLCERELHQLRPAEYPL